MSLNPDLKAINCTACGAGLDVLGGGRVTTHICAYCGSALDALDNYRALQKFDLLQRPETSFKIGTAGQIFDVDFTVIGLLLHQEAWHGRIWRWVDHQVFSPTHGYAWITLEEGHLTFSRRYRKPAGWMSSEQVNRADTRPQLSVAGEIYKYYDTSTSEVIFAEGEFTWTPRQGKRTTTVTALSETAMLSFSATAREREIYRTTYLERDDLGGGFVAAYDAVAPSGAHPLKGRQANPHGSFLMKTGLGAMLTCLVLSGFMALQGGVRAIDPQVHSVLDLPVTVPFDVSEAGRLTRIDLEGNGRNSWSYLAVELEDPEGDLLFESGRTVEYYNGRDQDGSWSEGSNRASLAFFPPVPGTYRLTLDLEETGLWAPRQNAAASAQHRMTQIGLRIRTGVSSGFWLMILALGFGGVAGYPALRRMLHNRARWQGSDWTEEDDD